jgi:hypothetical protein
MNPTTIVRIAGVLLSAVTVAAPALAHITPPVILMSDREAVTRLLPGARKLSVREVRLSPSERQSIKKGSGWSADEDFYRFYLGRDDQGRLTSATVFLTEYTIHGPVRVAVGLAPDGTIAGAAVVELTEETYPWLKPLLDEDFTRDYVGRGARGSFGLPERVARSGVASMPRFYAEIVASLLQRAALLYDAAIRPAAGTAPK